MTCYQVQQVATEYALGILPSGEARQVSAHILGCSDCRLETERIREIGDQLLDLVPDAEPPLGFDQRVLSTLAPPATRRHRRPTRLHLLMAATAAAIMAAAGITAATLSGQRHAHPAELTSVLREGNRNVGAVYVAGDPPWITMSVSHLPVSGSVSCELISTDGTITPLGDFQVVHGRGSWGAPDPAGTAHLAGAQVVAGGHVVALATFSRN